MEAVKHRSAAFQRRLVFSVAVIMSCLLSSMNDTVLAAGFDLGSTTSSQTSSNTSDVSISVGGRPVVIAPGAHITPAQDVAIRQVLGAGHQTIQMNSAGAATGGSFTIAPASQEATGLVIPSGVTALGNFTNVNQMQLDSLVNSGNVYAFSTSATHDGTILANAITNQANAVISSILPASILSLIGIQTTQPFDLSLIASQSLINNGIISSSGNLFLSAPGITNGGTIQSESGSVNMRTNSLATTGSVIATAQINVTNLDASTLSVQADSGIFRAGAINLTAASISTTASPILNVLGQSQFLSQQLTAAAVGGNVNLNAGLVSGTLSTFAPNVRVYVSGGNLSVDALSSTIPGDTISFGLGGNGKLSASSADVQSNLLYSSTRDVEIRDSTFRTHGHLFAINAGTAQNLGGVKLTNSVIDTRGDADGGDVLINSSSLASDSGNSIILNAQILASGTGSGSGGDVLIHGGFGQGTTTLNPLPGNQNLIESNGGLIGGNGGAISITGDNGLLLGGRLVADALGVGNGGKITVAGSPNSSAPHAPIPELLARGGPSGGRGGDVNVSGWTVTMGNADVSAPVGDGGSISINTSQIMYLTNSVLSANGGGNGGNITLRASNGRIVPVGAKLSANGNGTGNGGTISLTTPSAFSLGAGEISISATGGSPGSTAGNGGRFVFDEFSLPYLGADFGLDGSQINLRPLGLNGNGGVFDLRPGQYSDVSLLGVFDASGVGTGNGGSFSMGPIYCQTLFNSAAIYALAGPHGTGGTITTGALTTYHFGSKLLATSDINLLLFGGVGWTGSAPSIFDVATAGTGQVRVEQGGLFETTGGLTTVTVSAVNQTITIAGGNSGVVPKTRAIFSGNVVIGHAPLAISSLDMDEPLVVQQLIHLQEGGDLPRGSLVTDASGSVVGGNVIFYPTDRLHLTAEKIPSGVTVSFRDYRPQDTLHIDLTLASTTRQVIIDGVHEFDSSSGVQPFGNLQITSTMAYPALVLNGSIRSSGGLSLTSNGSIQANGLVSSIGDLSIATQGNATLSIANALAKNVQIASPGGVSLSGVVQALGTSQSGGTISISGPVNVTASSQLLADGITGASGGTVNILSGLQVAARSSFLVSANGSGTKSGGNVTITGSNLAVGAIPGTTSVSATGGSIGSLAGDGGTVSLIASQGLVANLNSIDVSPKGENGNGGKVTLSAGSVQLSGALTVNGVGTGNGGSVDVAADADLHDLVALNANAGANGSGGAISIQSRQGNVSIGTGAIQLSANAGANGGAGGRIVVAAAQSINAVGDVSVDGIGGGNGGSVDLSANGSVRVDGSISANGSDGGHVSIHYGEAGTRLELGRSSPTSLVSGSITANSTTGTPGSIEIENHAGDLQIDSFGTISAQNTLGSSQGTVQFDSQSKVDVASAGDLLGVVSAHGTEVKVTSSSSSSNLLIGDVIAANGGIGIQSSIGELKIADGATVKSTYGDISILNADPNGRISIGAGASIHATSKIDGTGGSITIANGTASRDSGPTPTNVVADANGFGEIFFNGSANIANPPDNHVTAVGEGNDVIVSSGTGTISFGGGVDILATIPIVHLQSLDLTDPAVVLQIKDYQSSGFMGGTLTTQGGTVTGSITVSAPYVVLDNLHGFNIPSGVTLSLTEGVQLVDVQIDADSHTPFAILQPGSHLTASAPQLVLNVSSSLSAPALQIAGTLQAENSFSINASSVAVSGSISAAAIQFSSGLNNSVLTLQNSGSVTSTLGRISVTGQNGQSIVVSGNGNGVWTGANGFDFNAQQISFAANQRFIVPTQTSQRSLNFTSAFGGVTIQPGVNLDLASTNMVFALNDTALINRGTLNLHDPLVSGSRLVVNSTAATIIASSNHSVDLTGVEVNQPGGQLYIISAQDIVSRGATKLDAGVQLLLAGVKLQGDVEIIGPITTSYTVAASTSGSIELTAAEINAPFGFSAAASQSIKFGTIHANGQTSAPLVQIVAPSVDIGRLENSGSGYDAVRITAGQPLSLVGRGLTPNVGWVSNTLGVFPPQNPAGVIKVGDIQSPAVQLQTDGSAGLINLTGQITTNNLLVVAGSGAINLSTGILNVMPYAPSGDGAAITVAAEKIQSPNSLSSPVTIIANGTGTGVGGRIFYTGGVNTSIGSGPGAVELIAKGTSGGVVNAAGLNIIVDPAAIEVDPTDWINGNGGTISLGSGLGGKLLVKGDLVVRGGSNAAGGSIILNANSKTPFVIGLNTAQNGVRGRLIVEGGLGNGSISIYNDSSSVLVYAPLTNVGSVSFENSHELGTIGGVRLYKPMSNVDYASFTIYGPTGVHSVYPVAAKELHFDMSHSLSIRTNTQKLFASAYYGPLTITNLSTNPLVVTGLYSSTCTLTSQGDITLERLQWLDPKAIEARRAVTISTTGVNAKMIINGSILAVDNITLKAPKGDIQVSNTITSQKGSVHLLAGHNIDNVGAINAGLDASLRTLIASSIDHLNPGSVSTNNGSISVVGTGGLIDVWGNLTATSTTRAAFVTITDTNVANGSIHIGDNVSLSTAGKYGGAIRVSLGAAAAVRGQYPTGAYLIDGASSAPQSPPFYFGKNGIVVTSATFSSNNNASIIFNTGKRETSAITLGQNVQVVTHKPVAGDSVIEPMDFLVDTEEDSDWLEDTASTR
jgi:hypothetical protein